MTDLTDAANRGKSKKSPTSLDDEVRNDESQEEPTQRYTLDIPRSLHKWLKKHAILEEERSMKDVTIDALKEYRERHT